MNRGLLIALISTDYPPLRTSAAVQLRDLSREFAAQGHRPVVIVPSPMSDKPWVVEEFDGVEVLRVAAPPTRSPSFVRRAIAEMWLPFAMYLNIRRSPFAAANWDLLVWYSPPIFFGPLIAKLKRKSKGKNKPRTYLILRDIFPEWAVDLGLVRRGPVYLVFKAIAAFQYSVAQVIGVQTESNLRYLEKWDRAPRRIEVLRNWLEVTPDIGSSIVVKDTPLAGRKIFVYIGNMGVAQGMDIFIDLIHSLRDRTDIGFLFVGRGTEFARLEAEKASRDLSNALFYGEIDSTEIPGLLAQCHVGMVALHPDHKTHNIPGKFVSYVQYGVPVLARVNPGTDLMRLIESEQVGKAYAGNSVNELKELAEQLMDDDELRRSMSERGRVLGRSMFSSSAAVQQIVASAVVPAPQG
ncbi:glycosyltransferase family 4 protein [Bradyrhizobium sp.]|jgi:glycosyltransferase involved in cell wall biosynthesis|uniref:glycosyltransferase family 4 protein n=1 Tax=Bradyrhizobium sp. TaxID=376 RepID=UPI002DDC9BC7|nr:glycosyltransferase family 4 protein [Bradyrhizobium sp.]HEV2154892.1 glycosyltransferase family 4 protein [Bradyrhizobium sp.]